ncbi:hypothetical protein GB2207_04907 [gamma proteobacterium HTCC2207]|jgi:hypothetical protein|uniref:Uncharacterized protein n=1 Tax=gamma proteobacterium HTCC2207 TaxID=314287 RepID=Q1YRV5_9GAMM|nr:hypothetical protein GB2207_04907 [gamma proteobacterium HTCC2207]MBT5106110.1 hypothetical protein [Porticoccaceae bacterium]MBT6115807.1 hypothetical protein [Porticoccaceae bacterium]MBT6594259.1 hypothetical protein [Porticoccaceae bacterium]MDG1079523.1 hypothetical protein [Porticoccaceae bacterium]
MSDDVDLDLDDDFVEEPPPELSEKRQAEVNRESRRRLEQKLEETRLKKQSQDYDFDLD